MCDVTKTKTIGYSTFKNFGFSGCYKQFECLGEHSFNFYVCKLACIMLHNYYISLGCQILNVELLIAGISSNDWAVKFG